MIGARTFMLFAIAVMAPALAGSQSAQALCFGTSCRNAVWQQGAQGTSFGGISRGARLTPYGVTSGKQTAYGVTSGRQTAFGVTSGQQTSYGVSAGHQTAYGVSAGHQTSYGVTSGQQTSFGVVGAQCRKTPWGYYCSDIRLKRDVAPVARLDDGLTLYRYRYLWSDEVYVGVMAQEVAAIDPAAVTSGPDGYLRVNYARLGLRLETWREWSTAH
jgi:endosialidase-like protein